MPTWGEPKRRENIRKLGELRLCAVGWLEGQVMHMTYTEREDDFHVISLREAEKYEVNKFFQEVSH